MSAHPVTFAVPAARRQRSQRLRSTAAVLALTSVILAVSAIPLGLAIVLVGAALLINRWNGIGRIASTATESIARQPEAAGDIRGVTIITAAFIEGVCLFAVVVCLLVQGTAGASHL